MNKKVPAKYLCLKVYEMTLKTQEKMDEIAIL